jgi:4-hydroxy-4-methyl-2-oxoglutarate aldolase
MRQVVPTNKREPQMNDKTISRWYSTVTSEAFMKVLFPGAVLVIDATDDGESRSIGSSNILSWKKLGMVGLVTGGGVLVRPGDVVVADGDGVVVVPRERAEDVAKAALPFLDNITRERYIKETGQNPWAKKPGGEGPV